MVNAISINKVTKKFGSKVALANVSLAVPKGSIFGFLGPNGAGKTTMIRCLMDYIRTSEGSISILGLDSREDSEKLKAVVGYLSSDSQLYPNWTARTHVDFVSGIKGGADSDELVKKFNLDLDAKVHTLSSGNKQKLAIILAFIGNPKLLIMDEPTRSLDPLLQNQLYVLIRQFAKRGGTVFFSSHNLTEVQQLCDNVSVIRAGKIVAAETMKDILQKKVHIIQVVTTQPLRRADFNIEGVEILSQNDKSINLKTRGELDQVMQVISKYKLSDLEVSHISLEDVFMEYY